MSAETTPSPVPSPTPAQVLEWIASGPKPWFPSVCAAQQGLTRDCLDEPLNLLRGSGLVKVVDWVRGQGQGYELTDNGRKFLGDAGRIQKAIEARSIEVVLPQPVVEPRLETKKPSKGGIYGLTTFDRGELARRALYEPAPAIVAPLLVLACVLWFSAGVFSTWKNDGSIFNFLKGTEVKPLLRTGGLSGLNLLHGDWWRLIANCFVHIGGLHLLLNMYGLLTLGGLAEGLWGRWRFLLIYFISGIAGGCLAMISKPEAMVAGASGAIWGLMTSTVVWLILYRQHLPEQEISNQAKFFMLIFALNVMISFAPGISWEAHLGGGVAGFLSAWALSWTRLQGNWQRMAGLISTFLIPISCIAIMVTFMMQSSRWADLWRFTQFAENMQFRSMMYKVHPHYVDLVFQDALVVGVAHTNPDRVIKRLDAMAKDALTAQGEFSTTQTFYNYLIPSKWRIMEDVVPARAYLQAVVEYCDALLTGLTTGNDDLANARAKKQRLHELWQLIPAK